MTDLRSKVAKLAADHPEFRHLLVPILKEAAECDDPGNKTRSEGKGKGKANGDGEGPVGEPKKAFDNSAASDKWWEPIAKKYKFHADNIGMNWAKFYNDTGQSKDDIHVEIAPKPDGKTVLIRTRDRNDTTFKKITNARQLEQYLKDYDKKHKSSK